MLYFWPEMFRCGFGENILWLYQPKITGSRSRVFFSVEELILLLSVFQRNATYYKDPYF